MMTKPGEQFVIRRNSLAMIRNAFQENGIEFVVPTVQVAGDRDAEVDAAVARYAAHVRAARRAGGMNRLTSRRRLRSAGRR
nr:hypothetical protein [Rhizobium leguminosarum]